ncbi:MAG: DNA-processing protein DprA [Lachnospiraceae bacterium]|nr:DNA-processing protein DprA [Lachnospiraceae bacterium]
MAENIHYIRRNSDYFPLRFEGLSDVPQGLYCIGSLPDDNIPSVAVVGARSCSSYGRKTAFALGKFLAEHGVQVISGMAMGIDSSAQEGALAAGGKTFAVLGCGVDICYPRTSYAVYDALAVRGGIIAEVEPGTKPLAYNFPRRNRIISALSDIVIVVEAREKSGSLITVDCALEQGRTVYAVPGRLGDRLSDGCNYLIAQGAGILWSFEAVMEELDGMAALRKPRARHRAVQSTQMTEPSPQGREYQLGEGSVPPIRFHQMTLTFDSDESEKAVLDNVMLSPAAKKLYACLDSDPRGADELSQKTNLPVAQVMSAAVELLMEGCIHEVGKNQFVRG